VTLTPGTLCILPVLGFGDVEFRFMKHKIKILGRPAAAPGNWVEVVTARAVKA